SNVRYQYAALAQGAGAGNYSAMLTIAALAKIRSLRTEKYCEDVLLMSLEPKKYYLNMTIARPMRSLATSIQQPLF
ncbi:MAG: hypothetical protein ACR2PS_01320, partial [Pseudomonadales bacterium]